MLLFYFVLIVYMSIKLVLWVRVRVRVFKDEYNFNSISVEIINYLKDDSGYDQDEVDLKAKDWVVEDVMDTHKNTESMLAWWKENRLRYPVLSVMARDYLAISASAVPCESTFSGVLIGGIVVGYHLKLYKQQKPSSHFIYILYEKNIELIALFTKKNPY